MSACGGTFALCHHHTRNTMRAYTSICELWFVCLGRLFKYSGERVSTNPQVGWAPNLWCGRPARGANLPQKR